MQNHQHGPQCRHGGHGAHGHGHGHGGMPGMPGMGFGGQQQQQSPDEYLKNLKKKWQQKQNRVFFWQEILHGVTIDRLYQKWGLEFMRSVTCQMPLMIVHSLQMMINFDWIPARIKPITCGLFFPLLFLFFFDYNVVVGVAATDGFLKWMIYLTVGLYVLTGLRGYSGLNGENMKARSKEIYEIRPYLENPQMNCQSCGIIRVFRATHCPFCKDCVAKHSRHSIVFGSCIGAANEFLCTLFFLFLSLTLGVVLSRFWYLSSYGMLTKVMFYLLNVPLCWMSFNEFLQFFVFNYVYGVTEQELKIWFMLQYLQKIPERGFLNNVDQGFSLNLQGSLMALFGIKGYESQNDWRIIRKDFARIQPNRQYKCNWDKAMLYLIPQLPFHKKRDQILQMMQRDEPRMIEMFKLQKKFKQQVLQQPGADQLSEMQLQQKIAMRMQTHMARNNPQMMQASPQQQEQQRMMQLQMIGHMKKEFESEPDIYEKFTELENKLKEKKLTPIETNMQMRMLQQELMARRMQKMQKQVQEMKEAEKGKQKEEEETPMREMADQDL